MDQATKIENPLIIKARFWDDVRVIEKTVILFYIMSFSSSSEWYGMKFPELSITPRW